MEKLGVTTTYKDVENLSVGAALERSAEIVPNKVCILFKEDRITFKGLNEQSNALSAALQ